MGTPPGTDYPEQAFERGPLNDQCPGETPCQNARDPQRIHFSSTHT
jgi:hypothetical protein